MKKFNNNEMNISIWIIDNFVNQSDIKMLRGVFKRLNKDEYYSLPREKRKDFLRKCLDRHDRNNWIFEKSMVGYY